MFYYKDVSQILAQIHMGIAEFNAYMQPHRMYAAMPSSVEIELHGVKFTVPIQTMEKEE